MRTQSSDTSPEAEQMLISLIRKAPITKRFELVNSLTSLYITSDTGCRCCCRYTH